MSVLSRKLNNDLTESDTVTATSTSTSTSDSSSDSIEDIFYQGIKTHDSEYVNPLFIDVIKNSSIIECNRKQLSDIYKYAYVLCSRNNVCYDNNVIMRSKFTSLEKLLELSNEYVLLRTSLRYITHKNILSKTLLINKNVASYFNHEKYEIEYNIIVDDCIDFNTETIMIHLKKYDPMSIIRDITLNKQFCHVKNLPMNMLTMYKALSSCDGFNFWCENYVDVNNTNHFLERNWDNDILNCLEGITNIEFYKKNLAIVQKLSVKNKDTTSIIPASKDNVTTTPTPIRKPNIKVKPQKIINYDYSTFKNKAQTSSNVVVNKPIIKNNNNIVTNVLKPKNRREVLQVEFYKKHYNELINVDKDVIMEHIESNATTKEEKYLLIQLLLIHKSCSHFILEKPSILHSVPIEVYRREFAYTWLMMCIEEGHSAKHELGKSRHIFTTEQLRQLPNMIGTDHNPYLSICLKEEEYLPYILQSNIKYPKNTDHFICDIETFKKRLNYFLTNDRDLDVFKGINKNNITICGSIMSVATIGNYSEDTFEDIIKQEYADADLDIACDTDTFADYIETVNNINKVIKDNLINTEYRFANNHTLTKKKKLFVIIDRNIIKQSKFTKLNEAINNNEPTKDIIYDIYRKNVHKHIYDNEPAIITDMKNPYYIYDIKYYETDITNYYYDVNMNLITPDSEDKIVMMCMKENITFKIDNDMLNRPIEIFRCDKYNVYGTISGFHLSCVRSGYNFETCWFMPSAVTAYSSGYNITFNYFRGNVNIVKIIDKYRNRGYGILLNKKEKEQYIALILSNRKLSKKYFIDEKEITQDSINSILAYMNETIYCEIVDTNGSLYSYDTLC
jgi:hypothetical protein